MYELRRLSISELLALNRQPAPGIIEKKDLIQLLIDQECIDLIPAPEPVEYEMATLRTMRISELKRVMEDAGVFFHSKDVVEKSDMLTIFKNSGRLSVLPSETVATDASTMSALDRSDSSASASDASVTLPLKRPIVETVSEDSDDEYKKRPPNEEALSPPQEMFGSWSDTELASRQPITESNAQTSKPHGRAEVHQDNQKAEMRPEYSTGSTANSRPESGENPRERVAGLPPSTPGPNNRSPMAADRSTEAAMGFPMSIDSIEPVTSSSEDETSSQIPNPPSAPASNESTETQARTATPEESQLSSNGQPFSGPLQTPETPRVKGTTERASEEYNENPNQYPLADYSISQLQEMARGANIDLSSCCERSQMVALLVDAGVAGTQHVEIQRRSFASWSVSQLRALASEVKIDLSQCADREDMLDQIIAQANTERPHLRTYLRSLSPLATSSLSELRSIARAWSVNISDCLEKEEIIQRLISRGSGFGVC
jgi:hypothetical protein